MKSVLQFFRSKSTPLGRWCHPLYSKMCDTRQQMIKGHQADHDNGVYPRTPPEGGKGDQRGVTKLPAPTHDTRHDRSTSAFSP